LLPPVPTEPPVAPPVPTEPPVLTEPPVPTEPPVLTEPPVPPVPVFFVSEEEQAATNPIAKMAKASLRTRPKCFIGFSPFAERGHKSIVPTGPTAGQTVTHPPTDPAIFSA